MKKGIFRATVLVFLLSFVAKVIGFVKSIIQAAYFGTTIYTDAFNLANGFVSNVLYMLATAIAVAFVPLYIQRKQKQDEKQFATRTITSLIVATIFLAIVFALLAPFIVHIIAPGYSGEEQAITIKYYRVLLIGLVFALTTHLYTSLLNSEKIYGFSAACSIINSIVLVSFIVFLSDKWGVWALVISVPVSYIIQWAALYLRGRKYAKISFAYGLWDKGIKLLIIQALPILVGQATVEINQVVDRALLSGVGTGALTAVSYSAVLYQFVTALVSTPLSTVIFTELAEAGAKADNKGIRRILNNSYHILLLVCIPVVVVMFFIPEDIVKIIYGYGKFTEDAIANCATGLRMYGLCLLPACIKTVLSRAYYAANDTKRPMVIGVMEVALNIGLSILLVRFFGISGVVGATALASLVFIAVMLIDFNRKHEEVLNSKTVAQYWKTAIASIVLIVIMIFAKRIAYPNAITSFLFNTLIAFAAFFIVLLGLRDNTIKLVIRKARDMINRKASQ